jgi:hypothetical protein
MVQSSAFASEPPMLGLLSRDMVASGGKLHATAQ